MSNSIPSHSRIDLYYEIIKTFSHWAASKSVEGFGFGVEGSCACSVWGSGFLRLELVRF